MRCDLTAMWREDDGALSFEWTLLATLLVVGIVSGLAGTRDALIDELGDVAQAMLALDGTYTIDYPLQIAVDNGSGTAVVVGKASDSSFIDFLQHSDCARALREQRP